MNPTEAINKDAEAFEKSLNVRPSRVLDHSHPWGWRYETPLIERAFRRWCNGHRHTMGAEEALAVLRSFWADDFWRGVTHEDVDNINAAFAVLGLEPK